MAKAKLSVFMCSECGFESAKWMGQCPACHEWNTFTEQAPLPSSSGRGASSRRNVPEALEAVPINQVEFKEEVRMSTGLKELDRVLGGGIVSSSLVLLGGDPGIGKSTILLQVAGALSLEHKKVLYVSGEESKSQIKLRADRIGEFGESMKLFCHTDIHDVEEAILREKPDWVVIDSIQTMNVPELSSATGSVSQLREASVSFMRIAKSTGIAIFMIGHVTKEGTVAGPRILEHMVDTVLYFEGDRYASYRILRSVKNRFGSTNEIGVFEMDAKGLRQVENPSEFMLTGRKTDASGSCVICSVEGSRPILMEIQALVSPTSFGNPRRTAAGADYNRLNLLIAVLEKRSGMRLSDMDAYVNIAGGVRVAEPATDLGILLAIASSYGDFVIDKDTVCFGEVGLSGEVRAVSMAARRVREARNLGFNRVILPGGNMEKELEDEGIELCPVLDINEAIRIVRNAGNKRE